MAEYPHQRHENKMFLLDVFLDEIGLSRHTQQTNILVLKPKFRIFEEGEDLVFAEDATLEAAYPERDDAVPMTENPMRGAAPTQTQVRKWYSGLCSGW